MLVDKDDWSDFFTNFDCSSADVTAIGVLNLLEGTEKNMQSEVR